MKKILFFILLCCLAITTYGQSVTVETDLNKNKEVTIGSVTSFNVKLNSNTAVSSESYMEITKGNGCFTDITGTADKGYTYRGTSIFNEIVYIKWKTAATGKVTMKISQTSTPTKTLIDTSWDVTVKPITDVNIVGPTQIMAGEEITYSLSKSLSLGSHPIDWVINDSRYAQIIGSATSTTVKIKALQTTGSFTIKASMTGIGQSFQQTIQTYPPIQIQTSGEIFCANSQITCSLQVPAYLPSPTIVWTGVDKFSLLSGQSTNTATFTASGNGYGTIRAVITSLGRSITIENSKVWIGSPDQTITADASKLSFLTTYKLYANNAGGATSYKWTLIGNATFENGSTAITSTTNQINIKTGTNNDPGMGQILRVTCEATNKCGTTTRSSNFMFVISGLRSTSIENTTDQPEIKSVKIYNLSGILVYSNDAVNGTFDINSTVLINGVYIIEKFDGENRTSEKVMLKR